MPAPTVVVLKPHDVVLAQVAAGLHLDDLQRHLAEILPPMLKRGGYIPTCDHLVPTDVSFEVTL